MNTTLQRSLTAIILGLTFTAVLVETLEYFGHFGPHTDTLIFFGVSVMFLSLAAIKHARDLERADRLRQHAEEQTRQLNVDLEQRVFQRTAELEAANKDLDAFAHSVSHDLRAPVRAISGFASFLAGDYASALDERGRGYVRRIVESTAHMHALIDDLLQFARAARAELRRQPVDLSTLAQEVAHELQQAEPLRQVNFTCTAGLPASGDVRLLRVALVNLLGNAWKYTGKVVEPQVELGRTGTNGESSFFVRDNGAGFDMQYAGRLFGAFQRLHSSLEFEGTGVGLATVQRIIHRHGGEIWADAKVNQGATFYFTLPERSA